MSRMYWVLYKSEWHEESSSVVNVWQKDELKKTELVNFSFHATKVVDKRKKRKP